ncbi:MAG TPA: trypsin-like peptidase domain-containing protein, partial [Candidatus Kapabacteria bacterium]|nr:trypsin-like peptidase domain-containing protein [Candidatus Kapabacteria bacterium]
MRYNKPSMHILLFYLLSFVSFSAPLTGCSQNRAGDPVYTVSQHPPNRDSVDATITGSRHNAITVAVAKASPAVVGINVTAIEERQLWNPFSDDPFFRQFFGGNRTEKYQVKALGSGFIISSDGYILTNDHVAGKATKIIVTTTDGSEYDAKLVGTDRNSDVSLLKIDGKHLPYLKFGNSDDLEVGEWAIAMGNPFGLFSINDKPTVTVGVVSNTGVNLGLEEGRNYRDMIQTDAAISSGNSGGPLLNANGEVIGMNATIRTTATNYQGEAGSIGLGFAIPINKIKDVVDRLRSGEKLNHDIGDLGMAFQDVNDQMREYFKLTSDLGVVVTQIQRGGTADRAGIQPGDLIVGFDTEKIRGSGELESVLADHEVGDNVTFHITR